MLGKFKDVKIAATGATNAGGPADCLKGLAALIVAVELVDQGNEVFHESEISQEEKAVAEGRAGEG